MNRAQRLLNGAEESWLGNTLVPIMQDYLGDYDLSTRSKAMMALSTEKKKHPRNSDIAAVAKWLLNTKDKEYKTFYDKWLK